jgi:deoxyribonuclease V
LRHSWNLTPKEAVGIQRALAERVETRDRFRSIRTIAGVDASFRGGRAVAAVAVMSYPSLEPVESHVAATPVRFPYVPGLLSFREIPAVLAAWKRLRRRPDLLMCDGHGLAHPRGFGLACHLGVYLEIPSIGCGKSLLCGGHAPVERHRGATAEVVFRGRRVGTAVRTREGVAPVYVSTGHRVSLGSAIRIALQCARTRIPEPIRRADQLTRPRVRN